MKSKKGQIGGRIMVVVFGTILIVAVAIPITIEIINTQIPDPANASLNISQYSGTTATVIGFIPLFLALAGLSLAAALVST